MAEKVGKVVLAYSGGLDTSIILKWLVETYKCEVVAFTAGIGQGDDLEQVKEKALRTGATVSYVEELQEEFVSDYVFPILRANAAYEGWYLLGTSIARPLIASHQIKIAEREGADAVSHGATGKGNDQVRFEVAYYTLKPDIRVIAPWREWDLRSRSDLIAYARRHGIPMPGGEDEPYSCDRNILHCSCEGKALEDPWLPPEEGLFTMTVSPEQAPDKPVEIEIDYEEGNPVAIDGERQTPGRLLAELNRIGGENGIGRVDMVENRFVGMKSRGVYETPGGTILHVAHRAIESITMDREVMHLRDSWIPKYAEIVYNGFWFSPERRMLQVAIDEAQRDVTGTVRLKLYKGNCTVLGRKSERSLYSPSHATFEADRVYDQGDAGGFIKLQALRVRIRSLLRGQGLS